ncbi:MAG TPA: hypothetical protein VI386_10920 [Candidatus Sulfotelmatobacter sp.]
MQSDIEALEKAVEWLDGLGLGNQSDRLHKYLDSVRHQLPLPTDIPEAAEMGFIFLEGREFIDIYEAYRGAETRALSAKLKKVLKGPWTLSEESVKNSDARNTMFELSLAAGLKLRGLDVELGEPDLLINFPEGQFLVECKQERCTVVRNVFTPIVDRETFAAARAIWSHKSGQLSDAQYLDRLRSLLKRKGRLNAKLINESSLTPSCSAYESRFGSLHRAYELIGYKRTDTFTVRSLSHLRITSLYRSLYRRLRRLFCDLRATHKSSRARPKTLRFSTGLMVAVAICPFEKTLKGEKRWRFESAHAQHSRLVTLLCFCKAANREISHFIVVPNASHIPTISMLKEHRETEGWSQAETFAGFSSGGALDDSMREPGHENGFQTRFGN